MRFIFAITSAVLLSAFGTAQASTVNFSGDNVNLGAVAEGQSGDISAKTGSGFGLLDTIARGTIPADSMITFTYTFLNSGGPSVLPLLLTDGGSYNFQDHWHYSGLSFSSAQGFSTSEGFKGPQVSTALLVSSANINGLTGTAEITNNSSSSARFFTELFGLFFGKGLFTYSYNVAGLELAGDPSANVAGVPLPASLPLFLAGMVVLSGIGYRKKTTLRAVNA